jgi:hypothetical protein
MEDEFADVGRGTAGDRRLVEFATLDAEQRKVIQRKIEPTSVQIHFQID